MAELVVGALLSASLEALFKRMACSEVLEFFKTKKLNDKLLGKLRLKLLSADQVLNDAEMKQIENPNVKEWFFHLQEVILDAQDLMEGIKTRSLKRRVEGQGGASPSHKVKNFISASFASKSRVGKKLKEIIDRLESVMKEKDRLGLQVGSVSSNMILTRTPATSLVEESGVYGRDADREAIVKFLLSDFEPSSKKMSVIPVVGMGGIGKTTLAQVVYNDDRVKKCFEYRVWVHVSEEFDIFKITKVIADRVTEQTHGGQDLDMLQVRLEEKLRGKKFLLVLDDVWNEKYTSWDELKRPFESGARGSRIIVTTRNEGVASVMRDVPSYRLGTLCGDDCWKLFVKHVFSSGVDKLPANPKLEEIGRGIVGKCQGLPLAIKSLGGLLRHQPNPEQWIKVLNSNIWELSKEKNCILPALWLSYYYLPPCLKRCFAFCSIFPKNHKIDKDDLIKLWMAEDLIQSSEKMTIEEVGEEYCHELLSRSFFKQSKCLGQLVYLSMHDLLNDLATFIGGEFCLRWNDGDSHKPLSKIRHFSHFRVRDDHGMRKYEDLVGAKHLRTMLLSSYHSVDTQLQNFFLTLSALRVLSLYGNPISKLPDSISNLKSLRYLDLSYTKIEELPNAVCALYNLQTMLLRNCSKLKRLPTNLGKLINLRHLDLNGTYRLEDGMPIGMCCLKDMQTLTHFILGKHGGSATIKELQGLELLRGSLRILKLENVVDAKDVMMANLKDKQYLRDLEFSWTWSYNSDYSCCPSKHEDVLNGLQPCTNIKFLKISSYKGENFPNWIGDHSFCNLDRLHLIGCNNCFMLPPLGQLPFLKHLLIEGFDKLVKIGDEFYYRRGCSAFIEPFRCLESLQIHDMQEWQEWSFLGGDKVDNFPNLKKLSLKYCPNLSGGLCLLNSIETVDIRGCYKLDFPGKQCYASLRWLTIQSSCHFMKSIQLDCLPMLNELHLEDLQSLESLTSSERPAAPSELMFLRYMELIFCREFVSFPQGGFLAPNLQDFWILHCYKLRSLPEHMHTLLPSLQTLHVVECPELESFGEGGLPCNLSKLILHSCGGKIFTSDFQRCNLKKLTSLTELKIVVKDEAVLDSLQQDGLLPRTTSLTQLSIQSEPCLKALNRKILSLKMCS